MTTQELAPKHLDTTAPASGDRAGRRKRYLGYALAVSGLAVLGGSVGFTSASSPIKVDASVQAVGHLDADRLYGFHLEVTPKGGNLVDPKIRVDLPSGFTIYTQQTVPPQYAALSDAPVVPGACGAGSTIKTDRQGVPKAMICALRTVPADGLVTLDFAAVVESNDIANTPLTVAISGASVTSTTVSTVG